MSDYRPAGGSGGGAPSDQTYLTATNETAALANSIRLLGTYTAADNSISISADGTSVVGTGCTDGIAIGSGANANAAGTYNIAIGTSVTTYNRSVVIGSSSEDTGGTGVVIGYSAHGTGGNNVSLGNVAQASTNCGIAIGYQATSTGGSVGTASIALGAQSNDDGLAGVLSIGATGAPRAIAHLGQIRSDVGTLPTNSPGTGAGTGATATITGTDLTGTVSVTTAGTPAGTAATIITVTFNVAYQVAPQVLLFPSNAAAAALSGATGVFTTSTTATFLIKSGATGLTTGTTYLWQYIVAS